jgi:predicted nucleotidyltransferase/DNA-binding XRE family transcriptional regulator
MASSQYLSRYHAVGMDVRSLIRGARTRAGLTQAQLAKAAGTSQSAIGRYETGSAQPSLATLERLLAACGERIDVRSTPAPNRASLNRSSVRRHRHELREVARRHGGRNLRVFGSTARGQARADSDVDLLVDLEPGRTLLDLVALRQEASAVLGRPADVVTVDMLREPVRTEAERDAVPV